MSAYSNLGSREASFNSPLTKKCRKIDPATYKKRCSKGMNLISNVISRVILSRKKIIWDVLEEIRASKLSIKTNKECDSNTLAGKFNPSDL